jgi:hypothetical protein
VSLCVFWVATDHGSGGQELRGGAGRGEGRGGDGWVRMVKKGAEDAQQDGGAASRRHN